VCLSRKLIHRLRVQPHRLGFPTSPSSPNLSNSLLDHVLSIYMCRFHPTQYHLFESELFEENIKSHQKTTTPNERRQSFSNTAHLPTKSSETSSVEMDRLGRISGIVSVENARSYLSQIGAGANHEQNYHENTRKVKDGAHYRWL